MNLLDRKTYGLYFYLCFLGFMVVRYYDGLFLSQINDIPIQSPRVDPIVWTFHGFNITELFANPTIASIFDGLLILLPVWIVILLVQRKKASIQSLILTLLFGIYVLVIYCFPTLSIRKYLGLLLIGFAFAFISDKKYSVYLEIMRYFIIFAFSSAALWKFFRGAAFDPVHMQQTLKSQHIDNFINWPDHFITQIISEIVDRPILSGALMISAVLLQLSFSIGFFTKKYDKILAGLLLLFILTDFLFMRIEYWEYIVFLPLLLGKYDKQ